MMTTTTGTTAKTMWKQTSHMQRQTSWFGPVPRIGNVHTYIKIYLKKIRVIQNDLKNKQTRESIKNANKKRNIS